jgi:hypothetical protein
LIGISAPVPIAKKQWLRISSTSDMTNLPQVAKTIA